MRGKRILVIFIIIILLLALAGIGAYLYIATDVFKSDKQLFSKYISQNVETINQLADSQTQKTINDLNNQEKYEATVKLKTTYSEGGEVSSSLNDLSATIDVQKDQADKYFYADGQVLLGDQKYLESELIKDQGTYGVRFTDVVKQFISVKDDNNLETVASDLGTDSLTLEKIMNVIDGTSDVEEEVISDSDSQKLKEKYSKIIIDTISSGTFKSNKNAVITYNNNTVKTKAYTVTLSKEQVENMLVQILNQLKTESIIIDKLDAQKEMYQGYIDQLIEKLTEETDVPEVKITVYEKDNVTIRTVFEIGLNKVTVENTNTNGKINSRIQIAVVNSDKTDQYSVNFSKENTDQQEKFDIVVEIGEDDDKYIISLSNQMNKSGSDIQIDSSINYKKDILNATLDVISDIKIGSDFEKKQTLSDNNNFVLNDADENVRKNIIQQLKVRVPEKANSRLELLINALGFGNNVENNNTDNSNTEMTQVDINKFNAKFEFYTGDEVSAENVKTLLEVVKNNLGSYEINQVNDNENSNITDSSKIKYSIKLAIEKDKTDEDGVKQISEKIKDRAKYKVSITYNETNNLINTITIDEVSN